MIRVVCGECGARFKAKEEYAGRRGQCPRCQSPVRVPTPDEGDEPADESSDEAPATDAPSSADGGDTEPRAPSPPSPRAPAVATPRAPRRGAGARRAANPRTATAPAAPRTASPRAASPRAGAASRRRPKTVAGRSSLDAAARLAGVRQRRRAGPLGLAVVLVIVVGVMAWGIWYFSTSMRTDGFFSAGMDHLNAGEFALAQDAFARVSPDDPNWATAQEKHAEVVRLAEQQERMAREDKEAKSYTYLMAIHDKHLGAFDPRTAEYAAYARYLLVRADEFLQIFPESEHADEVSAIVDRLAGVASPDEPPSELDARIEVDLRVFGRQYGKAWEVIEAFDRAHPGESKVLIELKTRVHEGALGFWEDLNGHIERELLQPGHENWPSVLSRTQGFLDLVAGVPGVGREAQVLHDKARDMVGG